MAFLPADLAFQVTIASYILVGSSGVSVELQFDAAMHSYWEINSGLDLGHFEQRYRRLQASNEASYWSTDYSVFHISVSNNSTGSLRLVLTGIFLKIRFSRVCLGQHNIRE